MSEHPIVPLGTKVQGGWTVAGVASGGSFGERYYLLTRGANEVAQWPAHMVEPQARTEPVEPPRTP